MLIDDDYGVARFTIVGSFEEAQLCLLGSASQVFSTTAVIFVSGVHLSFRPFPTHRTWAPTPSCTSSRCSPVNSDKRNPVCTATSNKA
jgi:hypothetical protein